MIDPNQPKSPNRLSGLLLTAILTLALALPLVVRLRLLATPFERDEGEYAYAGQLLLDGIPPFAQAFNMKMPGIYAAYAAVMALFGQTVAGVHFGLLLVQVAVTVAVFLLGRSLGGWRVGATAATFYGILSLSLSVLGLFPNAEFWVLLPAVTGLVALLRYAVGQERGSTLFLAGVWLGTGFILKQHGIAFVACGAVFLLWNRWAKCRPGAETTREIPGAGPVPPGNAPTSSHAGCAGQRSPFAAFCTTVLPRLGVFLTGAGVPFLLVCAWMAYAGVFGRFWFWTFTYAKEYVAQVTLMQGLRNLGTELASILAAAPLFWALAAIGLVLRPGNDPPPLTRRVFPGIFLFFGFLATCPGLFFRQHYFILLLPAVALLAALGLDALEQRLSARFRPRFGMLVFFLLLAGACALPLLREQAAFFRLSPPQVSRLAYGGDPFPESPVIAAWIRNHTQPTDRIAVIGSEPQLYFLSRRKAATGFIYMYPLMEAQPFAREMQEALIRDLEKAVPTVLVYVNTTTSWLMRPNSPQRLFEWLDPILRTYYQPVLFADIRTFDRTDYVWGEKARSYAPQAKNWVGVFRLRASPPAPPPSR